MREQTEHDLAALDASPPPVAADQPIVAPPPLMTRVQTELHLADAEATSAHVSVASPAGTGLALHMPMMHRVQTEIRFDVDGPPHAACTSSGPSASAGAWPEGEPSEAAHLVV